MKLLLVLSTVVIMGCAGPVQHTGPSVIIESAIPNCVTARMQIKSHEHQIEQYYRTHPGTLTTDGRRFIAWSKNIIWSLKSTCAAHYL